MTSSPSTPRLRITLALFVVVLALVAVSERRWATGLAGEALHLAGLACIAGAALGRVWSSVFIAGFKDASLVRSGPYAALRHPLYALSLLAAVGVGLTTRSVAITLGLVVALGAIHAAAARREDALLGARHGAAFDEYRGAVRAFLPRWSAYTVPERSRSARACCGNPFSTRARCLATTRCFASPTTAARGRDAHLARAAVTEPGEVAIHKRDLFGTVRRREFTRNSTTEDRAERDTGDAARGLGWLARRLAAREARALEALRDLPQLPRLVNWNGRQLPAQLAHGPAAAPRRAARPRLLPRRVDPGAPDARGRRGPQRPRQGAELAGRAGRPPGAGGLPARDATAASRARVPHAGLRRPAPPAEAQAHVLPREPHRAAACDPRAPLAVAALWARTGKPLYRFVTRRPARLVGPRRRGRPRRPSRVEALELERRRIARSEVQVASAHLHRAPCRARRARRTSVPSSSRCPAGCAAGRCGAGGRGCRTDARRAGAA